MTSTPSARIDVSVVIPVYNAARFLRQTLASISGQDYPHANIEVIIVDDGSTDESGLIIDAFAAAWDGQVRVLEHPNRENRGIVESYRLALQHCRGAAIAFLEHDDFWHPTKLSAQQRIFERFPEVGVSFSDVYPCNEEGDIAPKPIRGFINRPPNNRPFHAFSRLLWGNFALTFSNIMVRRSLLSQNEIVDNPKGFQDWMFLLQVAPRCQFYYCEQTSVYWRQRDSSYHKQLMQRPGYKRDRLSIIERWALNAPREGYLRFNIVRALYCRLCCFRHALAVRF